MLFKKYTVDETEKFVANSYPEVINELAAMTIQMKALPIYHKENIIISYFKDHSIHTNWIEANVKMAKAVTSGEVASVHIESLFEACKKNKTFLKDFEDYIRKYMNSANNSTSISNN